MNILCTNNKGFFPPHKSPFLQDKKLSCYLNNLSVVKHIDSNVMTEDQTISNTTNLFVMGNIHKIK